MNDGTPLIAAVSAAIGAAIVAIIELVGRWIIEKEQAKQAIRSECVKIGVENWRAMAERAEKMAMPRHNYMIGPMDGYIIHTLAILELVSKGAVSERMVKKTIKKLAIVGSLIETEMKQQQYERRQGSEHQSHGVDTATKER